MVTVFVSIFAQCVGVALGLVAALMRRSRLNALRYIASTYVLIMRGTPVIVQIFFVYFGTNILLGFDVFPNSMNFFFFTLSGAIVAGALTLAVNEGAYMSEIIRAGIDAIDPGQSEAAASLGMTPPLTMRRIILPQAWRIILPALGNQFNGMIKSTSLLAFIGVYEIFLDAQTNYSVTFKPVENFGAVALWYLLLTTLWSFVQHWIEFRLDRAAVAARRLSVSSQSLTLGGPK
jgi:polar amino acid transport system permease protein